jgi:NCS1 family nucleobase:cation symporter-1
MTSTAPVPAPVPVEAPPHMESHGIDLIPDAERHGSPRDLFAMWLGGNLNVFYVVNGAVVISMGLSFAQSLLAIVVGNLAFLAVGFASLQGPRTGTSTFAVSRASYGPSGGRFLALFNWVTCIGFEASGLALIALAALAVFAHAGLGASTALKIAVIVVASAIQAVLPLLGHRAILLAQRRLAWLFTVLFVVMAILVGPKVHLGHLSHGSGWAPAVAVKSSETSGCLRVLW